MSRYFRADAIGAPGLPGERTVNRRQRAMRPLQLQGWLSRICGHHPRIGEWIMATGDMFLKLEGIEGESNDDKKKNHIEIQSFSLGGANNGSLNTATGGGTSKVSMQDMHFTKQIDKSSPNLFGVLTQGKHIDKATITVRKAGGDPKDYLVITLTPCIVSSYNISGHDGGGMPSESFSLNYDKIEFDYKTQDDKGQLGASIKKVYEVSKNKAS
jgi:type VI secretion system secreted protein Hcp